MKEPMYRYFKNRNMAYGCPINGWNRIKLNHPDIIPLYNAFKVAVTKGTSRSPVYAITEREMKFFEHILFTMENYEDMTISERCLYIERMVRRSKVYRDNLIQFSREKVRRNLEEAYDNMRLKLAIHNARKNV